MSVSPNSLKNLEKSAKFTKGDSRIKNGRTKGSRNRKAIFLEWLEVKTECKDPNGKTLKLPLIDQVAIGLINKATQGDARAATFVLDCAYGRLQDMPVEQAPPQTEMDWSKYNEEQLEQFRELIKIGLTEEARKSVNLL